MNENYPICHQEYNTPAGKLILGSYNDQLCLCAWADAVTLPSLYTCITKSLNTKIIECDSKAIRMAIAFLNNYFNGIACNTDIPLLPIGSDFMKAVWNQLANIPVGQTISYKDLAMRMGCPKAVRAVGHAVGQNPLMILYPCHRVIGSNGKLTGYAGGLNIKKYLLDLESQHFKN